MAGVVEGAVFAEKIGTHLVVGVDRCILEANALTSACAFDTAANGGGGFSAGGLADF